MATPDQKFRYMLWAAYCYYELDSPVLLDSQYDILTKQVSGLKSKIKDRYKKYVDFKGLKTCSSLEYLRSTNFDMKE